MVKYVFSVDYLLNIMQTVCFFLNLKIYMVKCVIDLKQKRMIYRLQLEIIWKRICWEVNFYIYYFDQMS